MINSSYKCSPAVVVGGTLLAVRRLEALMSSIVTVALLGTVSVLSLVSLMSLVGIAVIRVILGVSTVAV